MDTTRTTRAVRQLRASLPQQTRILTNGDVLLVYASLQLATDAALLWQSLADKRGKADKVIKSYGPGSIIITGGNWWTEISGLPMEGDW